VNSLHKLDGLLRHFENAALTVLLASMIVLAVSQIALRNFADTGFQWADPVLRILVLWLGKTAVNLLTDLFSAVICALVGWFSFEFVVGEAEFGLTGAGNVPVWIFQSIIPTAFMLIAARFGVHAITHLLRLLRNERSV
jgi:TRAP-type C4-dicarboxylate transport system permease small subunit